MGAGSDLTTPRFGLADGRNTWSRPVDSTPDGASGDEGALIGTGDRRGPDATGLGKGRV
ncbi:hypothetical protein ABZ178_04530 [Streptomyces massasporeus]|uniref:hypothetical protein n=1 Tax=Streptomyces massasporeus TaxID=67324 RepID=UPI0033A76B49